MSNLWITDSEKAEPAPPPALTPTVSSEYINHRWGDPQTADARRQIVTEAARPDCDSRVVTEDADRFASVRLVQDVIGLGRSLRQVVYGAGIVAAFAMGVWALLHVAGVIR